MLVKQFTNRLWFNNNEITVNISKSIDRDPTKSISDFFAEVVEPARLLRREQPSRNARNLCRLLLSPRLRHRNRRSLRKEVSQSLGGHLKILFGVQSFFRYFLEGSFKKNLFWRAIFFQILLEGSFKKTFGGQSLFNTFWRVHLKTFLGSIFLGVGGRLLSIGSIETLKCQKLSPRL